MATEPLAAANPFTVSRVLKRKSKVEADFTVWRSHWQTIAEWLFNRKATFFRTLAPAQFLDREIFDQTGPLSLDISSSAFIGMLWPNAVESFDIMPGEDVDPNDIEAQEYFQKVTAILADAMDDPAAGLDTAMSEYGRELLAFGNGAVSVTSGTTSKLRFDCCSLQNLLFDEGTKGCVDVIFHSPKMTVEQAVNEYGLDNVHENIRKAYMQGRMDEHLQFTHAILPRPAQLRNSRAPFSKTNMPYISLHIDEANKHFMRISGFEEPSIIVGRMDRMANEIPGKGPGSRALPEIVQVNIMREAITLATEQRLDPALYVWADIGSDGTIDKSPGAVNVFRPKHQIAANAPAGVLFETGNMNEAKDMLADIQGNIKSHFYLDRLLDLNNNKQMTAYETMERKIIRSQTMKDPAKRQYAEFYTPLITRSLNILWRAGLLGVMPGTPAAQHAMNTGGLVIPDSVAKLITEKKPNPWKIRYKTPAMRELKLQSVQNNMQFLNYTSLAAQATQNPSLLSIPDGEAILRSVAEGLGVVANGLRSRQDLKKGQEQADANEKEKMAAQLAAAAQGGDQLAGGPSPALKVLQGGLQQGQGNAA